MRTAIAVILASLVLASCSAAMSDSCRQQINDCTRTCPANTIDPNPTRPRGFLTPTDTRSECELRCRQGCTP